MDLFKGSLSYRQLLGDEIRVLILPPGAFDDPICCKFKHVSLSECPAYEALSYTWGDPTQTSPISVNGAPCPITRNLESAFRHLRRRESSRILWVDAVCINQLSIDERSSEVMRMKSIYKQAMRVVIWIGECAPHTKDEVDSAFRLADRMFQKIAAVEYDQGDQKELNKKFADDIVLLEDLIRRPWFTRVWTIQEAVVCMTPENYIAGPGHPIVVCGQSSIPFSRLAILATEIVKLLGVRSFDNSKGNSVGICWIFDLRSLRHDIITGTTRFTLAEQLCLFLSVGAAGFEATDERDKIYALLGLVHGESLPTKLRPNYNYSADRVFWDYGTYILKETRNLDILACCSTSRSGLPSWVPDWKSGFPIRRFNLRNASYLRFLEGNNKIEVECMILNRIVQVFEPGNISVEFPEYITLDSKDPSQLESISKEATRAFMKNIIEVSNYLVALETKIFGCKVLDAGFETSQLCNWIYTIGIESGGDEIYRTLMNIDQFNTDDSIMLIQLCSLCVILASTLRYAVYEDDHGNIERTTRYDVLPKPGDKICYIKGAKFKFILRPEADEWRLIGPARGYFPLSHTEVALGDLKSLKDPKIRDDYEKSLRSREFEDLQIMEDYWQAHKSRATQVVIH